MWASRKVEGIHMIVWCGIRHCQRVNTPACCHPSAQVSAVLANTMHGFPLQHEMVHSLAALRVDIALYGGLQLFKCGHRSCARLNDR